MPVCWIAAAKFITAAEFLDAPPELCLLHKCKPQVAVSFWEILFQADGLFAFSDSVVEKALVRQGGPEIAAESIDHLRRYVELLFNLKRDKEANVGRS